MNFFNMKCKKCSRCNIWQDVNNFKKKDKYLKSCLSCRNKRNKKNKKINIPYHILKVHVEKRNIIVNSIKNYFKKIMSNNNLIRFIGYWAKKRNLNYLSNTKGKERFKNQLEQKTNIIGLTALSVFKKSIINEIKTLSKKDIKILCSYNRVQKILYKLVDINTASLITIRGYCSEINAEICNNLNEHNRKKLRKNKLQITIKYKDTVKINEEQNNKVKVKNNNIMKINYRTILKLTDFLKNSIHWNDKLILFSLCTGVRFVEILDKNTSIFTECKKENHMIQEGVAKAKNTKKKEHVKPVLFVTVKEILKLNTDIRNEIKDIKLNKKQLTARYSKKTNNRLKELFNQFSFNLPPEEIHFHILRRLYANYAFEIYKKKTNMSYPIYIQSCLGHSSGGALLSYSNIRISFDNEEDTEEKENTDEDIKENYRNIKTRGAKAKIIRLQLLNKLIKQLKKEDISVNYRILKSYGYGSRIITSVLKKE